MRSFSTLFLTIALCASVRADEVAEQGRAVYDANRAAVVTVETVLSMSFGGEEREHESWANGTVVDASGLTVFALSALDPTSMGETLGGMPDGVSTRIVAVRIQLADGKEIPAQVVLRDKDLDLVFVRPTEAPAEPLPHVDLEKLGTPQLLDNIGVITQLGEVARRAHTIFITRIESVIEKPRTYYLIGADRANEVMCSPAFTLDGGFVGIGVMRAIRSDGGQQFGDNVVVIIVPSADIKEAAAQVPPVGAEIPDEVSGETPAPEETEAPESEDGAEAPSEEAPEEESEESPQTEPRPEGVASLGAKA